MAWWHALTPDQIDLKPLGTLVALVVIEIDNIPDPIAQVQSSNKQSQVMRGFEIVSLKLYNAQLFGL